MLRDELEYSFILFSCGGNHSSLLLVQVQQHFKIAASTVPSKKNNNNNKNTKIIFLIIKKNQFGEEMGLLQLPSCVCALNMVLQCIFFHSRV